MNRKGLTLIELLAAIVICCLALTAAYKVFLSGVKLSQWIKESITAQSYALLFFSEVEKDLKNSVVYTAVPFRGDNFKISFASLADEIDAVRYDYRNGSVFKNVGPQDFGHPVLRGLREFSIEYAYQDEKAGIVFLPYWNGQGLPKAVRLSLAFSGKESGPFSNLVILPQGNMGKIN